MLIFVEKEEKSRQNAALLNPLRLVLIDRMDVAAS